MAAPDAATSNTEFVSIRSPISMRHHFGLFGWVETGKIIKKALESKFSGDGVGFRLHLF